MIGLFPSPFLTTSTVLLKLRDPVLNPRATSYSRSMNMFSNCSGKLPDRSLTRGILLRMDHPREKIHLCDNSHRFQRAALMFLRNHSGAVPLKKFVQSAQRCVARNL